MSEILNRREKIAGTVVPVIPAPTDFVKPTDKASKTKLGLVKIGDGIEVSSAGVISVTQQAAGFTKDLLFEEGVTPTPLAKNATVTLAHNYSDYKIISITMRRGTDGCTTCFYDASVTAKQLVPFVDASGNWALCGTTFSDETPTTLKIADASNTTNMYISKVYGYK